jgi:hypothetical protein
VYEVDNWCAQLPRLFVEFALPVKSRHDKRRRENENEINNQQNNPGRERINFCGLREHQRL